MSIRDVLSWVNFINVTSWNVSSGMEVDDESDILTPVQAYMHGACLVFLDALGAGKHNSP